MIKFSLQCDKSHNFEAWFRSGADYDAQKERKIIACPVCGTHKVEKSLMAPNVGVKTNRKSNFPVSTDVNTTPEVVPPVPAESAVTGLPEEVRAHVLELAREIRDHVTKTADNVGENFAEEARKIHYEEAEPRGIYGKATPEEARELNEEGIDVHALPVLPEEHN